VQEITEIFSKLQNLRVLEFCFNLDLSKQDSFNPVLDAFL
jgi:hypothetical protein